MAKTNWSRALLKKLTDNPDMIKLYFIPALLFLLDSVIRKVLEIPLIDAGADMAFLAMATYISLLIEDTKPRQTYNAIKLVFIIISMALWVISLKIVSNEAPWVLHLIDFIDFRFVFSWFIGLASFFFSGVMTREIVLAEKNRAR